MTEQVNNGGPAFPEQGARGKVTGGEGMSLRAYFAAHAPDEPQGWFEPVMTTKRPNPERPDGDHDYERDAINTPEIIAWDAEYHRQRYIQWPLAWADEQIAQLNAQPQSHLAEQPASVPQYVVEALACAEDALAKAYAVGCDLDSEATRNTKALATVREALSKLEHPTESCPLL